MWKWAPTDSTHGPLSTFIQWQRMRCGSGHPPSPPMAHSFICSLQFRLSPHCSNECPASVSQAFHEHISKIKESTYLKALMGVSAYQKNPFRMEAKPASPFCLSALYSEEIFTQQSLCSSYPQHPVGACRPPRIHNVSYFYSLLPLAGILYILK